MNSINYDFKVSRTNKNFIYLLKEELLTRILGIPLFLYFLIFMTYDFVKSIITKKNNQYEDSKIIDIINVTKFHLTKRTVDEKSKEHKLILNFNKATTDQQIFMVKNNGIKTDLDNECLTEFKHKINNNHIIFQRVRKDLNTESTSDLIIFDCSNGRIIYSIEIGKYVLNNFDTKKKIIQGESKKGLIKITI